MSAAPDRPRLLVVNQYYWPGPEATARVLTELCESLAADWDVTVVAGTVAGAAGPGREVKNGVEIVRVRSTAFSRRLTALRALNYLSYLALAGPAASRRRRPDVVLSMTDPPLVGVVGASVAARFGVPFVAVVQDVFPAVAVALGRLRAPGAARLLRRLARIPLRRASAVVSIGETMRERLVAEGAPRDGVVTIPNWVDTEALAPVERPSAWARRHALDRSFVVMHSGNFGFAQDLDTLLHACALVPDVRPVLVGGGTRRAELVALARSLGVDALFLPYQPASALAESLSAGDVHVVGLARGLAGLVVPSRIYGVLAVGRPVVAAVEDGSETAAVVREAGCGLVVPPGDPERLAAALAEVRGLDLDELGRRGREWVVANADRRAAVDRYRALLAEVRSADARTVSG